MAEKIQEKKAQPQNLPVEIIPSRLHFRFRDKKDLDRFKVADQKSKKLVGYTDNKLGLSVLKWKAKIDQRKFDPDAEETELKRRFNKPLIKSRSFTTKSSVSKKAFNKRF